jgi:membrane-bound inhibitor of C-type lysozyme
MKKYLMLGAAAALFAACGEQPLGAADIVCGEYEISAKVYADRLDAKINGQDVRFNQSESASGARYASAGAAFPGAVLWNKGASWMFVINDAEMPIDCLVKGKDGVPVQNVPTPEVP